MYQNPVNTNNAIKLPIPQDSIAVEAGKERFWKNTGTQTLEPLVHKTKEPE